MITIPSDVVQQTVTITGLQLNPIYGPDGTFRTIRIIAVNAAGQPAPNWAQPNRRQPTSEEMAAIVATPMLPGEVQVPAWLDRASMPFLLSVYGDLIHPAAGKGPREVSPPLTGQRPPMARPPQAPPPQAGPGGPQPPFPGRPRAPLYGQQRPVLPAGMPRPPRAPGAMNRPQPGQPAQVVPPAAPGAPPVK